MADHIRTQIRDRVINSAVLGNLTTSGARIYTDRVTALTDAETGAGALRVYMGSEPDPEVVCVQPRKLEHQCALHVDLVQKTLGDFAKALDTMEKEVDAALFADVKLNGLAKEILKGASDREDEGDGDKPTGVRRLIYTVIYQTLAPTPDVAAA